MSRIIVYGLDNSPVGEFSAKCNRGWVLLGNTGVEAGGYTTIAIPKDIVSQPWLQLGRMVLIERAPLPAWAGVIDAPWKATLPAEITLYNAEYLFSLRSAEQSSAVIGPFSATINEMIRIANAQEQMYVALGTAGDTQEAFDRVIEQGNLWDQMLPILQDAGYEMILRPERDTMNHLYLYADVGVGLGVNTNALLSDGDRGNMTIVEATVNGNIRNRVKGVSGTSTEESQLQSDVLEDQPSQDIYRTRSEVVQFRNVTQLSLLNQYTQTYLSSVSRPFLDITMDVKNINNTFASLRQGNTALVHASKVYLPGGIVGWRGYARILAMVYDEDKNTVRTTVRAAL